MSFPLNCCLNCTCKTAELFQTVLIQIIRILLKVYCICGYLSYQMQLELSHDFAHLPEEAYHIYVRQLYKIRKCLQKT